VAFVCPAECGRIDGLCISNYSVVVQANRVDNSENYECLACHSATELIDCEYCSNTLKTSSEGLGGLPARVGGAVCPDLKSVWWEKTICGVYELPCGANRKIRHTWFGYAVVDFRSLR
jgi:hypothetical protein